jgi:hypothetical protein
MPVRIEPSGGVAASADPVVVVLDEDGAGEADRAGPDRGDGTCRRSRA